MLASIELNDLDCTTGLCKSKWYNIEKIGSIFHQGKDIQT